MVLNLPFHSRSHFTTIALVLYNFNFQFLSYCLNICISLCIMTIMSELHLKNECNLAMFSEFHISYSSFISYAIVLGDVDV